MYDKRMRVRIALILVTYAAVVGRAESQNVDYYCSITKDHTMCKPPGYGPKCEKPLGHGVSSEEKNEILREHNKLRAKVANGQEPLGATGPQPPAADMKLMEWDDELAAIAQRHSDQCELDHDCWKCRRVKRFDVGQNLKITWRPFRPATNWKLAITHWYSEVKMFNKDWLEPFPWSKVHPLHLGHYTAMIWANTNKIGCGLTEYQDGERFFKSYTCDYGPAGNRDGGQMYKVGKACGSCPSGIQCSNEYPGLCGSGDGNGLKKSTKILLVVMIILLSMSSQH